jgi:hypothetical protein
MCTRVVISGLWGADGADGRRPTSTSRLYYETVGRTGPKHRPVCRRGGDDHDLGVDIASQLGGPSRTVAADAPRIAGWAVGVAALSRSPDVRMGAGCVAGRVRSRKGSGGPGGQRGGEPKRRPSRPEPVWGAAQLRDSLAPRLRRGCSLFGPLGCRGRAVPAGGGAVGDRG